ncbi:nucleoside hydrolase [Lactobacillus corticis]|uniref:Nucleoside hydrolase n=1 Tax=Lactobacillus corticis TaxID=2201249 RepID=A0A916QFP1_9LACO|nr:nucleoside hydrolase [Lactobacillus corticis]GFZ26154.1 nucleoside hydrolase [Lactobacillus corticis]
MKKIPVIISTDPGIDDAVALTIALNSPEVDVKLICPLGGNVSLENTTQNTLKLLTFLGKTVPVVKGSAHPLIRKLKFAANVHGETGMEGFAFPKPTIGVQKGFAVEAMHRVVANSTEKVTLIGIGPLTDIALFIHNYPADLEKVEELILMGGCLGRGNFGVLSEFNFGCDPEAASIVVHSGLKIKIAPMEVGRQARVLPNISEKIRRNSKYGEMFYALFKKYRGGSFATGLHIYDALAMGMLLKPEMFTTKDTYLEIETKGKYTAGASLFDFNKYLGDFSPNVTVATAVDVEEFERWFVQSLQ